MSTPPPDDPSDDETMFPLTRQSRPIFPPVPPSSSSPSPGPLQWTQQYKPYLLQNDPSDHVLLPPTALEQLLSATPFNTDLPQPLTFQLVNTRNSRSTHVGVREFSAPFETVGIPSWIVESLELNEEDTVTVSIRELPKATRVKLRPLEAGYIEDDWKALLESQLRTHTTLTKGETLSIRAGVNTTFRFLIDELEPADAVNLIDTDVTTEIEEMSEDNARKTQDQRIKAAKQRNAEIVDIKIDQPVSGTVPQGEYVYFRVKQWDRKKNLEVTAKGEGDVDLLLSTSEDWKPKIDMNIWSDMSPDSTKRIAISTTNVELSNAQTLTIGIHGSTDTTFVLSVVQPNTLTSPTTKDVKPNAHAPGFTQCDNCLSWVPERSLILHQNFCLRNNFRCPQCNVVVPKKDSHQHWHCEDCYEHGNSPATYSKHRLTEHTPQTCICGTEFQSLSAVAFHRATSCPCKIIKCRFCQTFKEQGDSSTLSAQDMFAGLTAHEADCGSRTLECGICGRRLRIKELSIHQQLHDNERKSRPEPRNCRNINCTRAQSDNPLGLCTICFGPLYSPMYDPNHTKLQSRLERKLLTQLMTGCGQIHCSNTPYCATAVGRTVSMSEALKVVKPQVDGMLHSSTQFHICVDEAVQRKAFLAGMISAEGVYGIEWARKAIEEAKGDLSKARTWLDQNGRRMDE